MKATTEHTENTESSKKSGSFKTILWCIAAWLGLFVLTVFWNLVFPPEGMFRAIGLFLSVVVVALSVIIILGYVVSEGLSMSYLWRVDRKSFWASMAWIILASIATVAFLEIQNSRREERIRQIIKMELVRLPTMNQAPPDIPAWFRLADENFHTPAGAASSASGAPAPEPLADPATP